MNTITNTKPLTFTQPLMHNLETSPGRWINSSDTYAISEYKYLKGFPCEVYYVGYLSVTGERLTERNKKNSLANVMIVLNNHNKDNFKRE